MAALGESVFVTSAQKTHVFFDTLRFSKDLVYLFLCKNQAPNGSLIFGAPWQSKSEPFSSSNASQA